MTAWNAEPARDAAGHELPCSCNAGTDGFVPIDVDAYEAAGVARIEQAQEPDCCVDGCQCFDEENEDEDGWHLNSDDCDHCPNCCSCVPCMYAHHA